MHITNSINTTINSKDINPKEIKLEFIFAQSQLCAGNCLQRSSHWIFRERTFVFIFAFPSFDSPSYVKVILPLMSLAKRLSLSLILVAASLTKSRTNSRYRHLVVPGLRVGTRNQWEKEATIPLLSAIMPLPHQPVSWLWLFFQDPCVVLHHVKWFFESNLPLHNSARIEFCCLQLLILTDPPHSNLSCGMNIIFPII